MTQENRQNGFSILELMMALAILAVGILAIVSMQINAIQSNEAAMGYTDAAMAAQTQMEIFISSDYTDISNSGASTSDGYTQVTNAGLDSIPAGYTLEYRVTSESDLDSDGTNDLMQIHIRVREGDGSGDIRADITMSKNRG